LVLGCLDFKLLVLAILKLFKNEVHAVVQDLKAACFYKFLQVLFDKFFFGIFTKI